MEFHLVSLQLSWALSLLVVLLNEEINSVLMVSKLEVYTVWLHYHLKQNRESCCSTLSYYSLHLCVDWELRCISCLSNSKQESFLCHLHWRENCSMLSNGTLYSHVLEVCSHISCLYSKFWCSCHLNRCTNDSSKLSYTPLSECVLRESSLWCLVFYWALPTNEFSLWLKYKYRYKVRSFVDKDSLLGTEEWTQSYNNWILSTEQTLAMRKYSRRVPRPEYHHQLLQRWRGLKCTVLE